MIIYGTNGKHFATYDLPDATCPACRTAGAMQALLVSRYAHVYYVPLFPFQKAAVLHCQRCHETWKHQAWPAALAAPARAARRRGTHPYWTWAGLLLLALLGAGGYCYGLYDHRRDEALLLAPRTGDVYTVHLDSANAYSLLKVLRVGGNGVELVANEYQTTDSDPINSLNEGFRYSKEPFIVTRFDLQIMRRKGQLTDVDRP